MEGSQSLATCQMPAGLGEAEGRLSLARDFRWRDSRPRRECECECGYPRLGYDAV
jgi:hypothetical protein